MCRRSRAADGAPGHHTLATAVFRDIEEDNLAAVQKAVKNGFEITARDEHGCSALRVAAVSGALKTAQFLIDEGIDVDARTPEGYRHLWAQRKKTTPRCSKSCLRRARMLISKIITKPRRRSRPKRQGRSFRIRACLGKFSFAFGKKID